MVTVFVRPSQAWKWYFNVVGRGRCAVVDTYWQTETGSIVISPYPGATPTKSGSATLPQFGVVPELLDPHTGKPVVGKCYRTSQI
jgi:acetyl-CoA synthetase